MPVHDHHLAFLYLRHEVRHGEDGGNVERAQQDGRVIGPTTALRHHGRNPGRVDHGDIGRTELLGHQNGARGRLENAR